MFDPMIVPKQVLLDARDVLADLEYSRMAHCPCCGYQREHATGCELDSSLKKLKEVLRDGKESQR